MGTPAFPQAVPPPGGSWASDYGAAGMDLRDYFAAKALPSFLNLAANRLATMDPDDAEATREEGYRLAAKEAYMVADAMIAARKVTP